MIDVSDLLHAGASYLRIHQKGFGAVGVSTKYGKRAFARYPIFWGMKDVGGLPNPDPTDTASWYGEQIKTEEISVDEELEASKPRLKRQAQNWAGFVPFSNDVFCPMSKARHLWREPFSFDSPLLSSHSKPYQEEELLTSTHVQAKARSYRRAFRLRWKVSAHLEQTLPNVTLGFERQDKSREQ